MRILFSGTPAFGHLLPMMPLAMAALDAGYEVAMLTNASMTRAVEPVQLLPAGPPFPNFQGLIAAGASRVGSPDLPPEPQPEPPRRSPLAEFFVGARLDQGGDEALAQAQKYRPDLIVAEELDFLGPLAATALNVPWVSHGLGVAFGSALPESDRRDMAELTKEHFGARGLSPTPRLASIDIWPDRLRTGGWPPAGDRITLGQRASPYTRKGSTWAGPTFANRDDHPLVLLTFGTVVDDADLLNAVLDSLAATEAKIIVTLGTKEKADAFKADRARVYPVGFVPLEQLLQQVSLVISVGGAGTVLSTLSHGLPMVLLPVFSDHPLNAECTAKAGAGVVAQKPEEVGPAVEDVLQNPAYRASAHKVAEQIAQMNSPERVLDILSERLARQSQSTTS